MHLRAGQGGRERSTDSLAIGRSVRLVTIRSSSPAETPTFDGRLYVPKLVSVLRHGYGLHWLRADALAGLTVAIVALPLAMALAIASGAAPEVGLRTAIIGGFFVSALGGSRLQIAGPTGAFVVVVASTIQRHGYDGLLLATAMAGVMLIVAGLVRFGTLLKYVPYPVVAGFTAGIAVVIASTQVNDLLGLALADAPAAFLPRWQAYLHGIDRIRPASVAIGAVTLVLIVVLRRLRPTWPGFLIAIVCASLLATQFAGVETIGSRFGGLSTSLPSVGLPSFDAARLWALLPDAGTIAFLAGIESLLSAVVADQLTGGRHRSNCELVAQGVANCASAVTGGLPVTGAIARTATNIRAGARTPVAGLFHALFLAVFLFAAAPLGAYVPLPALAAVLLVVAWNMSDAHRFIAALRGPRGDCVVLVATFLLTIFVDLTVAVQAGIVLASFLFLHRMMRIVEIETATSLVQDDLPDDDAQRRDPIAAPPGTVVVQITGPFFFGVTGRLQNVLGRTAQPPRALVLRLENVPLLDMSGAHALAELVHGARARGAQVVLVGLRSGLRDVLAQAGVLADSGVQFVDRLDDGMALLRATT
jgi:SulP family sulfate permease